jgi:hypothetical protein
MDPRRRGQAPPGGSYGPPSGNYGAPPSSHGNGYGGPSSNPYPGSQNPRDGQYSRPSPTSSNFPPQGSGAYPPDPRVRVVDPRARIAGGGSPASHSTPTPPMPPAQLAARAMPPPATMRGTHDIKPIAAIDGDAAAAGRTKSRPMFCVVCASNNVSIKSSQSYGS